MKKSVRVLIGFVLLMTAFMVNTHAADINPTPVPLPSSSPTVVTLKAPTASVESGEVAYGTEVVLSATDGHFYYSINGGTIQSTLFSSVTITITEDTTVAMGSWRDVIDTNTVYKTEEVTYTYTITENIEESPTPVPSVPQYPTITVEPPTVSVESGEVAYGTHVSISPTTAHVAYSVNGGDFVYSFTGAGITVTEDTTLVVKSWVDNLYDGVEYILPEATYTYTVTEELITGTAVLPDGITAPEGGMTIKIYSKRFKPAAGGAYIVPDKYLEYAGGRSTDIPEDTIYNRYQKYLFTLGETTVTIPYGENSADFSFISEKTYPESYKYLSYVIENDTYIGAGKQRIADEITDVALEIDCQEKAVINGTVTIPETDTDTSFTVVADGSDFNAVMEYVIPAGGTTIDYSLPVVANAEYNVYVAFDDDKYVRQSQTITPSPGQHTIDFGSFAESKKISGTINLPEGVTELLSFSGETEEYITGTVRLQSASAPYYYLDTYNFTINNGETSAYFELYDDIGVEDVMVTFSAQEYVQNIYYGGAYYDETKCVTNKDYGTKLKSETQTITLNMIKANTVIIKVDKAPRTWSIDLEAYVQKDENGREGEDTAELVLTAEEIDRESETTDFGINIPVDSDYYILHAYVNTVAGDMYLSGDKFIKNIEDAIPVANTADNYELNLTWDGYEADMPFSIITYSYATESEDSCGYSIRISNESDFEKNDIKLYTVLYDSEGRLISVIENEFDIPSHELMTHDVTIPAEEFHQAEEIYAFFWDDMRPMVGKVRVSENSD